jgi:hypothetical protein
MIANPTGAAASPKIRPQVALSPGQEGDDATQVASKPHKLTPAEPRSSATVPTVSDRPDIPTREELRELGLIQPRIPNREELLTSLERLTKDERAAIVRKYQLAQS